MSGLVGRRYSIDTSALIDGLERYYPEENFPSLWERIDSLVAEDRLVMSEEVWLEATVHAAAVKDWCERHGEGALVVPTDAAVAGEVQSILTSFPRLVMEGKSRNRADPFVVAVASLQRATVITGEAEGNANRPKIPFVCQGIGVPCVKFLDLVRLEGWAF